MSQGPLNGVKVVEIAGLGPSPMACMMLADFGADVVRIERSGAPSDLPRSGDPFLRSRRSVALDLKAREDRALALELIAGADVLVEGYRPGAMERLGLGPAPCHERNPRLVYARITGWGQDGPLAHAPGHDLNFVALTGALHAFGRADQPPTAPINLMGDYAGGALYAVAGVLAALFEAQRSGSGQVVDVAMIDGVALLMAKQYALLEAGMRRPERGASMLDGGAFFNDVYQCADGGWLAVGCFEPRFYHALLQKLEIDASALPPQYEPGGWAAGRVILAERFRSRGRDEWVALLADTETCVTPVLSMAEAPDHPHNLHRGLFVEVGGMRQPAPAPRFSRTPARSPEPPGDGHEDVRAIVASWGARTARPTHLRESSSPQS